MSTVAGMPVVGYRGHLRGTKESHVCYGTSHWRPTVPPSKAVAAAVAFESAKAKQLDSFKTPGSYDVELLSA